LREIAHRLQEAEEQAGTKGRPGAPIGEDERSSAMKPEPAVMSRTKLEDRDVEMKAPAMPHNTPAMITAR
jgi:hypothetical protein